MTRQQKLAVATLTLLLAAGALSIAAAAALVAGNGQDTVLVLLITALVLCSSAVVPLALLALGQALYANGGFLPSGQVRQPTLNVHLDSRATGGKPLIRETKLPRNPRA